jgi:hypothetical protein
MLLGVLGGVLLLMALGAGLAGWRQRKLQSSDTFAPTDHVEVRRGFGNSTWGFSRINPTVHHEHDPPEYQPGD